MLGSKENPCRNEHQIISAMTGRHDCIIYTVGTFILHEDIIGLLNLKNIKLCAVGYLVMR